MPSITVADALELPELRRGLPEVVAGRSSIDREIRWVHTGEVPNIAALLRGGELLLTTGMGIGTGESQQRFVANLASRNVAGLVIELGGVFTGGLPAELIGVAEANQLPLIELHASVRFVTVTEEIHTEIVSEGYDLLRRGEQLHRHFTRLMLEGAGVPGVLALLAETLGNPVFLETDGGRLVAHAAPGAATENEEWVAAWAEARGEADAIGAVAPVPVDGEARAWRLATLPLIAPLDRFATVAIGRAADLVALALLRDRQESELLTMGRGDVLAKLADGQIQPTVAAMRAREMGFVDDHLDAMLPLAARLAEPSPGEEKSGRVGLASGVDSWLGTLRELEREIAMIGAAAMVGVNPVSGELLVLVGLRRRSDRDAVAGRAAAVLHAAARRRARADLVVAAGPAGGWGEIGSAISDAIEAAAVAADLPSAPWHDATSMPLDRLLWRLGGNDHLRRYVDRLLGPVIAHDERRKHTLLPTLEALCRHGGQKAATARALVVNRQGLYSRIARLEEVLDLDLTDPANLTALDLAVRARRHLRAGG